MKITAFCPGHITGFFVPKKHHDDPLKSGSLGAGICVDKGAITTVTITEGKKKHRILGQWSTSTGYPDGT